MPADPIEFRIVQSLQTALKGIKVPGYHHDVKGTAVKLDPEHKVEDLIPGADPPFGPSRPWLVLDVSPSPTFEYLERPMRVRVEMPFIVYAIHDSDPTDDDAKLRTFFRLCADVEQSLVDDFGGPAGSGIARGGLATLTTVTGRSMRDREGQEVWAQVAGSVVLHRGFGAPNGP